MDQIGHMPASDTASAQSPAHTPRADGRDKTAWRSGAALAALGVAAGALALAARPGVRGAGRMPPDFAPAEKTLAWASPAVLGEQPAAPVLRRHQYRARRDGRGSAGN